MMLSLSSSPHASDVCLDVGELLSRILAYLNTRLKHEACSIERIIGDSKALLLFYSSTTSRKAFTLDSLLFADFGDIFINEKNNYYEKT